MFCIIHCKHLHMRMFVNNSNIHTTLNLYNIHQSSIRKSASAFEIMNAQSYTINCLISHFRIYAFMQQIVTLCGFITPNNKTDFVIKLGCIQYKQRAVHIFKLHTNTCTYKCLQRTEINIYLIYTYFELYHRNIFHSLNSFIH